MTSPASKRSKPLLPMPERIEHRRGMWWFEAPAPRKLLHRHTWETRAWVPFGEFTSREPGYWTERCACGATRYSDIPGWQPELKPRFRGL